MAVATSACAALFGSPKVTRGAAGGAGQRRGRRAARPERPQLLALLAENNRLPFLPEIAQIFDSCKADAERMVDVTVTSAAPMGADEQGKLVSRRWRSASIARCACDATVDPSLIGGAVVRAGDLTSSTVR